jgi:hypothetical protein
MMVKRGFLVIHWPGEVVALLNFEVCMTATVISAHFFFVLVDAAMIVSFNLDEGQVTETVSIAIVRKLICCEKFMRRITRSFLSNDSLVKSIVVGLVVVFVTDGG